MQLSDRQWAFIDDFGAMWDRFGASAAQGRILALLYATGEPELSANDIMEALGISRGAVSQHTRMLVTLHIIQRVSKPGDRRDWFRVAANPFGQAVRTERAMFGTFEDLLQRGLALHNTSPPERKRALTNSLAFLKDYQAALGTFLDTWEPPEDMETP